MASICSPEMPRRAFIGVIAGGLLAAPLAAEAQQAGKVYRAGIDKAPGGYEALHRFAVTQRELFRVIPPMPGAPAALRRLSADDVRIRIITHRFFIKCFHQVAARQTIEWLDYHDIPYWDLCFMQEKAAVGADLYIEDSPSNVERLRADNLETIVFTTNEHLAPPRAETWNQVVDLVLAAKARWTGAAPAPNHRRPLTKASGRLGEKDAGWKRRSGDRPQ
jgi:5'(3')-deoxyribonucleotidase